MCLYAFPKFIRLFNENASYSYDGQPKGFYITYKPYKPMTKLVGVSDEAHILLKARSARLKISMSRLILGLMNARITDEEIFTFVKK